MAHERITSAPFTPRTRLLAIEARQMVLQLVCGDVTMATMPARQQQVEGVTGVLNVHADDDGDGLRHSRSGWGIDQGAACSCVGRGVWYVVSGRRVTEQQARTHAAAGKVVCVVPQLTHRERECPRRKKD
jgi:hypothetical protein